MKTGIYLLNWNYREFLPWAVRSLIAQTRKSDILILVDDASTDGSVADVAKWFPDLKFDMVVAHNRNVGTVASSNEAVRILGEEYGCDAVCGLSADDAFRKDYAEKMFGALEKAPPDVAFCYSHVRRIGDENQLDVAPTWDPVLHERTPFVNGSAAIRYAAFKAVGGYPDVQREEDWEIFKAMARLGWRGLLVPEPLLFWRKHNRGCRTFGNDHATRGKKQ